MKKVRNIQNRENQIFRLKFWELESNKNIYVKNAKLRIIDKVSVINSK